MKHKWTVVMLLMVALVFSGCTANTSKNDEVVWVVAEQITYDENGDQSNRMVYEYEGSERNYRAHHYNDNDEAYGYTDIVQSKDGTKRTETHYYGNDNALFVQTDYEYREDGKPLSQKNIMNDTVMQERIWNWNEDGTVAQVIEDGVYLYTVEYDEQGREIGSYNEEYETVFTYNDQGKVIRTAYTDKPKVEYVVHKYDAQGRTIETVNYELDEDRPYTDDDMVAHSTCTYDADGHSYVVTVTSVYEYGSFSIHYIYKPLSELLK